MLAVTHTGGGLGDLHDDLVDLKNRVDKCVRAFPLDSSNTGADIAVNCDAKVGGAIDGGGILPFEKLTLLDQADNVLMFNIARTLLTNWRNTGAGSAVSSTENNVRRIAALKLGEESVLEGGPIAQAVQTLSSAGRIESNDEVKKAIIVSLFHSLKEHANVVPDSVRTEAITTLKIFADPLVQNNVDVLNLATRALKALSPTIEIGPVTVTPIPAPTEARKKKIMIAAGATLGIAALVTGTWFILHRRATQALGMGPLRRKVERSLQLQRRR